MRPIMLIVGVLLCAAIVVASAGAQSTASDSATLPRQTALSGDPGEAILNVKMKFGFIDSACFEFTFAPEDGLAPGESLRITPNAWLKDDPLARGPGFANTTPNVEYSRALCVVNVPGQPLDRFLDELLDGKARLALNADDSGSVTVINLSLTIVGT